jgi:hypothetical protein
MMATMIASPGGWSRGAACVSGRRPLGEAPIGARQTVAVGARLTTLRQDCGTLTIIGGGSRPPNGGGDRVESVLRVQSIDLRGRPVCGSVRP